MYFSIITPTYNRAHTLEKLYTTLKEQNEKSFEWIVVDDGSIDNTKDIIKNWMDEKTIDIKYLYQENKGKHIAVNHGIKNAKGKFIIIIDSDDYFSSNDSLKIAKRLAKEIEHNNEIAGFTGIHFNEKLPIDFSKYGKKKWTDESPYQWEFHGEMQYIYKKSIAQKFLFPEFKGEKFCPESVIHRRIRRKGYKILRTDNILFHGDYLENGLTNNYYKMMLSSPNSATLSLKEKIIDSKNYEDKIQYARLYWDIAFNNPIQPFYKYLFGINWKLTLKVFSDKIKKILKA